MKKKKRKTRKEDGFFVDLTERQYIEIVHSKESIVTDDIIFDFEQRSAKRYSSICHFTELCIQKNMEQNQNVSDEKYLASMQSMLEQNELLRCMLSANINKKQEN